MPIKISGKNVETGQALREHINTRVSEVLAKYFDGGYTGHVVVERDGPSYAADVSLHLDSGIVLQTHGSSHDIYPAVDQAADRLTSRLRRYKERLKSRHSSHGTHEPIPEATPVPAYVIATPDEHEEVPADFAPVIVAETTHALRTQSVGQAVLDLDLTGAPVVVFRNAGNGAINVVYRRRDGNVGWVDPSLLEKVSAN